MRLSKKIALLSICSLLLALTACGFAYPAVEGKFERTLNVGGPVDLDVTTGSGRIAVRSGSSSVVQITGLIRARDDSRSNAQDKVKYLMENPPIVQSGNMIRIGRIDNEAYRNNVSISYEILVPRETTLRSQTGSGSMHIEAVQGPVDGSTGSGSITMLNIGSDVTARTGSGQIELDRIAGNMDAGTGSGSIRAEQIGGSVRARTGSGRISVEQASAELGGARSVEVSTGSGSIEVSGVNGALQAHTGSGGITASGTPSGDWGLEASSGGVTVHIDGGAAFDLYARTSSGSITLDHPVTVTGTVNKRELRGKVREGGRLVEIRTGSGSIAIR